MRRIASLLFFAPVLVLASQGCALDLCTDFPGVCDPAGQGGSGGGSTTTTGTSGGGTGGATGGGGEGGGVIIPTECDPREAGPGATIPDTCGVFIDTSRTTGPFSGTKAAPFNDFALINHPDNAGVQLFYVCATPNGAPIDEQLVIERSAVIFGGFVDCANWTVPAADAVERTAWTAPQHEIPAVVRGAGVSVLLSRFAIESRNADGFDPTTLQGRSSVGMWVEGASVELIDSSVTAGAGAPGGNTQAVTPVRAPGRTTEDPQLFDGKQGGGCTGVGGPQTQYTCGDGFSRGGKGGDGADDFGNAGSPGLPAFGGGAPGSGDNGTPSWTCDDNNGHGGNGTSSLPATNGAGGTGDGTLQYSPSGGLQHSNTPGGPGQPGARGQGGGGGGGARGNGSNGCTTGQTGPSGGGGGAGGCGGIGAPGGGAGGSSIALVAVNASVALTGGTLTAVAGGAGGGGAAGQLGGIGGNPGNGGAGACNGGRGGNGGNGGNGGGGRGGASIGLAYVGASAPAVSPDAITIAAAAAAGGNHGGATGNPGAEGLREKIQEFPSP